MRVLWAVLLGLAVGLAGCKKKPAEPPAPAPAGQPDEPAEPEEPELREPHPAGLGGTFTVGADTTFVTGPLDAAGYIDYAAALNDRLSKGVTPENNANVAVWRVFGPVAPDGTRASAQYFRKLGIARPPARGNYFVGLKAYAEGTPTRPPARRPARSPPGRGQPGMTRPPVGCGRTRGR
jgi:hypothetical protein